MADPMTRAMFGQFAQHVPAWMYVQHQGPGIVSFVGASKSEDLRFGGSKVHQFFLGELIARPHFVAESATFTGNGLASLIRSYHTDFLNAPDVKLLCDPMNAFEKYRDAPSVEQIGRSALTADDSDEPDPDEAVQDWKDRVSRDDQVNTALMEETWRGVAIGFFLGKGFDIDSAIHLAEQAGY